MADASIVRSLLCERIMLGSCKILQDTGQETLCAIMHIPRDFSSMCRLAKSR